MSKVADAIQQKGDEILARLGIDARKLSDPEFNALAQPLRDLAEWMVANRLKVPGSQFQRYCGHHDCDCEPPQ